MATIISYADGYDHILSSGEKGAQELLGAVTLIQKISTRSFPVYAQLNKTTDAVKSRNDLANEMNRVKNYITKDAYNTEYYRDAFLGLFGLVDDLYGQTMDEYLTDNGLQVLPTFAVNSALFGQPISPSNIREA